MVAQRRGYKCIFVCPDKVSMDKINVMRAYGAEVVVCPTRSTPSTPTPTTTSRTGWCARRRARGSPTSTPTRKPAVALPSPRVPSCGSRPTVASRASWPASAPAAPSRDRRFLKEVSNGGVRVVGADPEGSVYSGGSGRPYLVEGVGEDFWADRVRQCGAGRDHRGVRPRLVPDDAPARPRGGSAGRGSCGMAVVAALRAAERLGPDDVSWCCCRTPDAATSARSSTTSGWPTTASWTRTRTKATRGRHHGPQAGRPARPGARSFRRKRRRLDRDPARVRGQPDAGGQARGGHPT